MTISFDISNHSNGSMALRNFFNELFLEKTGNSVGISDSNCDDDDSSSFTDDSEVSLISDKESLVDNNEDIDDDENDVSDSKTNSKSSNNDDDINASTNHTRRRRFRRSRGLQAQRPIFAVTSDNARGVRGGKHSFGGELRVSTYHNKFGSSSIMGNGLQTSTSAHSYSSLGSRTGISKTSVNKWRTTQQKERTAMLARNQHRDSRWSTTGNDIPKGSISKLSSSNRVKSYDFGFVNDSIHRSTTLRRKSLVKNNKRGVNRKTVRKSNLEQQTIDENYSCGKLIDSAVRVATESSFNIDSDSDSDSDGEEFYEESDDDGSISSFTMDTFDTSKNSNTSSIGSSLNFGNKHRVKSKATEVFRVAPSRARSVGDMPRLPRRTLDDSFDMNESACETFESLKGGSIPSIASDCSQGDFQRIKMLRSKSSDSIRTMAMSTGDFGKTKRRGSDHFSRWGASTPSRSKDVDSSLNCPAPPRRIPSTSNRSTGRYSNHSNDYSEPSETDSDGDFDFNNSFANNSFSRCADLDDSLATTVATTGSSNKDHSTVSTKDQNEALKILLPAYSGHHPSRMLKMAIPESFRQLPRHSYHGSSTISSKSIAGSKHPGKSLRFTSRKWT